MPAPRRRPLRAALALLLAGAVSAHGAAQDPFAAALPRRDTQLAEGAPSAAGEGSVSAAQGSASYRFPIEVPPGRADMQPALALAYSSNGPLRGGIAAGWSLDLPTIERDADAPEQTWYRLHLNGSSQLLVGAGADPGPGTRFRAELDESFARIDRTGNTWTVLTPDGRVRTFAGSSTSSDLATRWNLTSEKDAFGNEIVYTWSSYSYNGLTDYLLTRIEYTSNSAAGLAAHAKVELGWRALPDRCDNSAIPIGAQHDNRFGLLRVRGLRRLETISSWVRDTPAAAWDQRRLYTLGYDPTALSCATHAPLRLLTSIDESGWNAADQVVTAPPVRFSYGPLAPDHTYLFGLDGHLETGTEEGPESARLDFDGDGVLDRVRVAMPAPGEQRCRFYWRKGQFGGALSPTEELIPLPTARWQDGVPLEEDSCTLAGQLAWRGTGIHEVGGGDVCAFAEGVLVSYNFMDWDGDRDLDLLVQTYSRHGATPCNDFDLPGEPGDCVIETDDGGGGPAPCEGGGGGTCNCGQGEEYDPSFGMCHEPCGEGQTYDPGNGCVEECHSFEDCSGMPIPDPDLDVGQPTSTCGVDQISADGQWRVYYNDPARPGGVRWNAATADRLMDDPAQLPIPATSFGMPDEGMPRLPTLVDMNGDGWLDVIETTTGIGAATSISVLLNDGAGNFPSTQRKLWTKAAWSLNGDDVAPLSPSVLQASQAMDLLDVDGDGLPDLLVQASPIGGARKLFVAYNTGTGFAALRELGPDQAVGLARTDYHGDWHAPMPLTRGWRAQQRRWLDVDGDGLPERVDLTTGTSVEAPSTNRSVWRAQLGVPGHWIDPIYEPLEQAARAMHRRAWYRQSDYLDVTGDGVPDLVTASGGGLLGVRTAPAGTPPMRLMTRIDNGRGGVIDFTYRHTAEVVPLAPGRTAPSRWVVTQVTTAPGSGQPTLTTSYAYADPATGKRSSRDLGPPAFLGFERVTATRSGQAGVESSRTITTYDFQIGVDRRGQAIRETTELWTGAAWQRTQEIVRTFTSTPVANVASHFTYASATTTTTYDGTGAAVGAREERETWTPWLWTNGHALFFEHTESRVWEASPIVPVVRITRRDYAERVGQSPYPVTDYRILPILEEEQQYSWLTGTTTLARTDTIRDGYGLPTQTVVATGTTSASTVRTFNAQTGQVLTEKRPRQVAAGSSLVTTFGYDAYKLYVASTTNERGHVTTETRDLGTGAVVRRTGPNVRNLTTPGCTQWCLVFPYYEPEEWTVDGFGRVREHRVATEGAGGHYALTAVAKTDYYDALIPTLRVDQKLRDLGGTVWVTTADTYDGLGRALSHVAYHQEAGKPEAITSYTYDAGGGLRTTRVPDPRESGAYNGGQVTFTYDRDGLGRVTRTLRPDGSEERVVHDGLTAVTTPYDGGVAGAATTTVHDALGRLRQVKEHDNPGAGQLATTEYGYDVLDRMTVIRNADNQLTSMTYDQRGLRTGVTRGARTWTYVYDLDGNLTEQRTPPPAGGSVADHTSTTAYDELGRPTLYTPATRGLTASRRTQLGIGPVATTYDTGANAIGHVNRVAQTGLFAIDYTYDVAGMVKREQRNLTLGGTQGATLNVTEYVDRTYNALGAPSEVIWSTGPRWRYRYDARGQVQRVEWLEPSSNQYRTLADYTRTVAGAPRLRTAHWDQRRTWSYDAMGRVTYDRVYSNAGTTWAERDYGYDGFGELLATGGQVAGLDAEATYAYDARGRVKNAQGPDAYTASLTYSAAGNVLTANVMGAPGGTRDVSYQYGAVDAQAVDRLVDRVTGNAYLNLTYDQAGNVATRGASTFTWGGDDQLREVARAGGTERYYYAGPAQRIAAIGPDGVRTWFGEMEGLFTSGGALTRRWHHVAAGEPIARVETAGSSTTLELQYGDALQNLMLAMSTSGSVVVGYVYGAFGEVVASAGATTTHRRHFNGKDEDVFSGLRFYGYRSYDPLTLRWAAGDPLYRFAPDLAWTEPQRANLYAFSLNNPVRYYDPDGRDAGRREHPEPFENPQPPPSGGNVTGTDSWHAGADGDGRPAEPPGDARTDDGVVKKVVKTIQKLAGQIPTTKGAKARGSAAATVRKATNNLRSRRTAIDRERASAREREASARSDGRMVAELAEAVRADQLERELAEVEAQIQVNQSYLDYHRAYVDLQRARAGQ